MVGSFPDRGEGSAHGSRSGSNPIPRHRGFGLLGLALASALPFSFGTLCAQAPAAPAPSAQTNPPKPAPESALPEATLPAQSLPPQAVPAAAFPDMTPPLDPQAIPKAEQTAPGAGAQIRTGSVIGQGGPEDDLSRMENLLADHQFATIEALLKAAATDGTSSLTQPQLDLFRGVLANRENKSAESIQLLAPLVDQMGASGAPAPDPAQEKLLRKALAEDYLRVGDWGKAAQAYKALENRVSLSPEEKDEIELPLKLLPLAAGHPAMTVEYGEPFSLPYDRDALGLMDIPVFVDAQSHDWMLDPTAPFNLICRSTAKAVGLKLSDEAATVHTITGRPIEVHATIIPRFTLGNITFRNMTAFVFEDADYFYKKSHYQVRGVLGYPAVSALGSVTITANARVEVQPGEKGEHLTSGARFYLDGDRVMVDLGHAGEERMFQVDASGQQTYLTSRYFSEHSADFTGKKMQLLAVPGAASKPPAPAYVADSANLVVGNTPVSFHYIQVLTEPLGEKAVDDSYGILGVDALDELKSYTFDYRTMLFGAKSE